MNKKAQKKCHVLYVVINNYGEPYETYGEDGEREAFSCANENGYTLVKYTATGMAIMPSTQPITYNAFPSK